MKILRNNNNNVNGKKIRNFKYSNLFLTKLLKIIFLLDPEKESRPGTSIFFDHSFIIFNLN